MPTPPSNPLTMLRKLGTSLIGQDGLLTTAASTALGYSPMDRVKTRLAAQSEVQGQEKFKQELDAAKRKAEADRVALETNTYNLGRSKTVDAQTDAERAARGSTLAGTMVPGPPNPDGSPIVSPDAAIGMARGKADLYALDKASGQETMTAALANELKNLGIDPGVQVGEKFDTSQLDKTLSAFNLDEARKARIQASRDAQAARYDYQRERLANANQNQFTQEQQRVFTTPVVQASQQVLAAANRVNGQVKNYDQSIRSGDPTSANQILSEAITVAFAKVQDPNSVVREGEVTRLLRQWGLIDQANNWLNKQVDGGVLGVDALKRLAHAIDVDAGTSYKLLKSEQDRLSQIREKSQMDPSWQRDLTIGYTPSPDVADLLGMPAPPAPRLPGAPLSPPAPTAPGTNLFDNLHRKFPQKR